MIRIGNLTVLPDRRQVFIDGAPVELGYRAIDVLLILVEANGALVTKGRAYETGMADHNSHG
jgi:DNA-binding winged helix-turn-helix (wHTH) protein